MKKLSNIFKKIEVKIIILLFGSKKKYKNIDLKNVNSILINCKDFLGDTLVAFSHARQLKKIYPNSKIGIVATDRNREFINFINKNEKIVDKVVEKRNIIKYRKKWELLLDFYNKINARRLIWTKLLSPKIIMIFGQENKNHYYNRNNVKNYDFDCNLPDKVHILDYLKYSEFSKYFDMEEEKLSIKLLDTKNPKIEKIWNENSDKKIKVLLAPQGSDRHMKPEEVAKLLNKIEKEQIKKIKIVMGNTKGSEEYYKKLLSFLDKNLDFEISFAKKLSISEYIMFIDSSDFVIGVDGGVVHMACALSKPLLSFYANNEFNLYRWSPRPNEGVDSLNIISNVSKKDTTPRDTYNFPMEKAIEWLNNQIKKLDKKRI